MNISLFKYPILLILLNFISNVIGSTNTAITPQNVKLALTSIPSQMVITWYTEETNGDSIIHYSNNYSNLLKFSQFHKNFTILNAVGKGENFTNDSWLGYAHSVLIENLNASTNYFYMVGGNNRSGWSSIFRFSTQSFEANATTDRPTKTVTPFTVAIYGDMGNGEGFNETVSILKQNVHNYDLVIHVGDISYCDYDQVERGNQTIWNDFLKAVHPITSVVPYMTTPGNHDVFYSLTAYQQTFGMPATSDEPWYSFNYNGVHFLAFSSESDLSPFTKQYQWIKSDLEAYRRYNPSGWIIAYAHRPYYCSTQWDWCRKQTLRALIESTIGSLFQKYNVDLFLAGHTHAYERTYPVYQQLNIGNYDYPGGTIHMVIGTPGNQEGLDKDFIYPVPSWSASRSYDYGYAQFHVYNNTHILWQFLANKDKRVTDEQWIVKGFFD